MASDSAGDFVVIPPGVRQPIRNVGKDELVFLAIRSSRFWSGNYVDCDSRGEWGDCGSCAGEKLRLYPIYPKYS